MGLGSTYFTKIPTEVKFPKKTKVKHISQGSYHSSAIDYNGNVFLWGTGKSN